MHKIGIMSMDYEKLHKDTLAGLQRLVSEGKITEKTARSICADFVAENEDEKYYKMLHDCLSSFVEGKYAFVLTDAKGCLAWLEKQKEQKPAEWSEEDKKMIEIISNYVKNIDLLYDSFKICGIDYKAKDFKRKVLDWLKSLRPQPHWKPSEEQMEGLYTVLEHEAERIGPSEPLKFANSLYDDLKKLM